MFPVVASDDFAYKIKPFLMNLILLAVISLGGIGLVSALVLYFASKKFAVTVDPLISEVSEVLPQANCGGCGYAGCSGFAEACVKADNLDGLVCTVGGASVMGRIAAILGREVVAAVPRLAVVRCAGTCAVRPKTTVYDGVKSCAVAALTYGGETRCSFGCLGYGDCVDACQFGGLHVNPATGLVEVDDSVCVGCGSCIKVCPRGVLQLRDMARDNRRVYVACVNHDKGAEARAECAVACIGCGKCVKACPSGAVTLENNLAYIDYAKCDACGRCVGVCPQKSILAVNIPVGQTVETAAISAGDDR